MANIIGLAKKYVPLLDEVYKKSDLTLDLMVNPALVREGMTADTVYIAKTVVQGLGDYDRANGYTNGDVQFSWELHQFTQDRGRMFNIDAMDDLETVGMAFGTLANEFIRTQVVPETNAYRFAKLANKAGTKVEADLDKTTAFDAIENAIVALDDAEVPAEGRILYVAPNIASYLRQATGYTRLVDTNGAIDNTVEYYNGIKIVVVPQGRFYTDITLNDGITAGQEAGGYTKTAVTGKNINFLLLHPSVCTTIVKTATPKIITPELNQTADAYKFGYRLYHDIFVYDNKLNGIYLHNATV